jgi:hypothetical protein
LTTTSPQPAPGQPPPQAVAFGTGLKAFSAGTLVFALVLWLVPYRWCARDTRLWYLGDSARQLELARGVARQLDAQLTAQTFTTGDKQFDGEWLFGTYQMAGLGFAQIALQQPELRAELIPQVRRCVQAILRPDVRAFDRHCWGDDPIESLETDHDHAAFLGYFNLVLGLHRRLEPDTPHAALHDRITAALVRRIERSPTLLIQTYPGEVYPVDNAAVIGSIGLHPGDHCDLIQRWTQRCRQRYVDRQTGLLVQCVTRDTGEPADEPRGSGTALGLYFLSFADWGLSRELYTAARRQLAGRILGFGVVREYPRGVTGRGDIDSGPILFGYGISATGFLIAGSRIHHDAEWFTRLASTAYLFGAPLRRGDRREYVTGGPLGNAILLAMLTAKKEPID